MRGDARLATPRASMCSPREHVTVPLSCAPGGARRTAYVNERVFSFQREQSVHVCTRRAAEIVAAAAVAELLLLASAAVDDYMLLLLLLLMLLRLLLLLP